MNHSMALAGGMIKKVLQQGRRLFGARREFLATFKEFPPSQKVGSFSLDNVLEKLSSGQTGGR